MHFYFDMLCMIGTLMTQIAMIKNDFILFRMIRLRRFMALYNIWD